MRYLGQGYELTVPVPGGPLDAAALAAVRAAFDDLYAARYGYANRAEPVEAVTWKLSTIADAPALSLPKAAPSGPPGPRGRRRAYFPETQGWVECPVYDRHALTPGEIISGPAIVEERESTTVLPPGTHARVDEYTSLIATIQQE